MLSVLPMLQQPQHRLAIVGWLTPLLLPLALQPLLLQQPEMVTRRMRAQPVQVP